MEDIKKIWALAREGLREQLSPVTYHRWIEILDPVVVQSGILVLEAPDDVIKNTVSEYYSDHIRNAALMHHERYDGSGYPMRISGKQIDPYARIVAIADVYDAMTAARVYRGPLCPFRVIEIFEQEGFEKYDVEYLLTFLENVVNTYLQCDCKLSDGRKAKIIFINKDKLSRPTVQCGNEYIKLADHPDLTIEELL